MVNPIANTFIFISHFLFSTIVFGQINPGAGARSVVKPPATNRLTFSFQTGATFWGQQINLVTSDRRTEDVVVELKGVNLGFEGNKKFTRTGRWRTTLGVKTAFLQGQAQSKGTTITYKEPISSNILILMDVGIKYYPHENVFLGSGIGFLYNKVNLNPKSSIIAQYDFDYSNPVRLFVNVNMGWMFTKNFFVNHSLFSAENDNGLTGWNISVGYML